MKTIDKSDSISLTGKEEGVRIGVLKAVEEIYFFCHDLRLQYSKKRIAELSNKLKATGYIDFSLLEETYSLIIEELQGTGFSIAMKNMKDMMLESFYNREVQDKLVWPGLPMSRGDSDFIKSALKIALKKKGNGWTFKELSMPIGFCHSVIYQKLCKKKDVNLDLYDQHFNYDSVYEIRDKESFIENVRHAFGHSRVSFKSDEIIKLYNPKTKRGCEYPLEDFIIDSIQAINDVLNNEEPEEFEENFIRRIINNVKDLMSGHAPEHVDILTTVALMQLLSSVQETLGFPAEILIDSIRKLPSPNDDIEKFNTSEYLHFNLRKVRNAFVHLDFELEDGNIIPMEKNIRLTKPLSNLTLSRMVNQSQILLSLPKVLFCFTVLYANLNYRVDVSTYIPLGD